MSAQPSKTTTDASQDTDSDMFLRQFVGYNMKRCFLLVRDQLARTLEPLGLRMMTFSALAVIVENPDISQSRLAQLLHIERSGVVVLVDELESADLIARHRVEGDRRAYALRATLTGQKLWTKAEAAVRAHEAAVFSALSVGERKALSDLLARVGTDRD